MPERLDRVTVSLNRFDAVGACRPVELTGSQRTALLLVLEGWSLDLDGDERMPQDLFALRDALIADLHDAR
jgi:hypothetical protein